MSRTTKTRPINVRMLDPKDVTVGVEQRHNHAKGYCDLPERGHKEVIDHFYKNRGTYKDTCHYTFSYQGVNICGCAMCTGHFSRRAERRADRHNSKVALADHAKLINSNIADVADVEEDVVDALEELGDPKYKVPATVW